MSKLRQVTPVIIMVIIMILLGYPLALIFGLPLAKRDMNDLRKWTKQTISASAPDTLSEQEILTFTQAPEQGVLVKNNQLITRDYQQTGTQVQLNEPLELFDDVSGLASVSERVFVLPDGADAAASVVYAGGVLQRPGVVPASPLPDGQQTVFTFADATGPLLLNDSVVTTDAYQLDGAQVTFVTPPAFGSDLRRVQGDYALLDEASGTLVFAEIPALPVQSATQIVRLAEQLQGERNGVNTVFSFAHDNLVENDKTREVFKNNQRLSDTSERPAERVDGTRVTFSFESDHGIITNEDIPLTEGQDYTRNGTLITFTTPPARNAKVRQYPDFFLTNPAQGEITLGLAPEANDIIWTQRYSIYDKPACGQTVLECFYALPQHPVPFPHWIAARVPAFFAKYALTDERNVVRATLYTSLGTLAALVLGGAVGIILAVLFVLFQPLERALLPWTIASQTIPIIALVPVMLLILGNFGITIQTSLLPTAIIGAYICFFPVVVSTVKGLRAVDPLILDLMRSYAAHPLEVFWKVRFPAAVPFFFTGLKLGTAAALVGALVAETESNNRRGLGFQILGQVQSGNVADVWILLIVSGLLGVALVALVDFLQRRFAPWQRQTGDNV